MNKIQDTIIEQYGGLSKTQEKTTENSLEKEVDAGLVKRVTQVRLCMNSSIDFGYKVIDILTHASISFSTIKIFTESILTIGVLCDGLDPENLKGTA